MKTFDMYKLAKNQWDEAMHYHNAIQYGDTPKEREKQFKERDIQKKKYDKAIFFYKLYDSMQKVEEREKKECSGK